MKLADWLYKEHLTPEQLRRMLGVTDTGSMARYLSGKRVPGPAMLHRIHTLTDGAVTFADFDDPSPPRCAEVIIDITGEPRLVFPWSRGQAIHEEAFAQARRERMEGDTWSKPVRRALEVLGDRVRVTHRQEFYLDGQLRDIKRVIREANRVLGAFDLEEIRYPGVKGLDE